MQVPLIFCYALVCAAVVSTDFVRLNDAKAASTIDSLLSKKHPAGGSQWQGVKGIFV
jgi:hypothetical protein